MSSSLESPAVDVCAQLSAGWNEFVTSAAKFAEKREKLAELTSLADGCPRIQVTGATSEVILSLSKLLRDSNLIVVAEALKCVQAIERGAKSDFGVCGGPLLQPLFGLLKEKKTSVLLPARQLLDALFPATQFDDMWESIADALGDKMAKIRHENLSLLSRCLSSPHARSKVTSSSGKTIADAIYRLVADPDADVREQAIIALAALIGVVGRKPIASVLQMLELTDSKKAQRLDALAGDSSSAVANTAAAAAATPAEEPIVEKRPATSAGRSATLKKSSASGSLTARPSTAAAASAAAAPAASASAPPARSINKSATLKKASSHSEAKSSSADVSVPVYSYEDSLESLSAHPSIGSSVCGLIVSKKWNETVDGLVQLQSQVAAMSNADVASIIPQIFYFLSKTPSLKPSNVQVTKQIFETVKTLTAATSPFPSSLITITLSDLFNKVSDKKFAESIYDLLLSYGEAIGPRVVVSEWMRTIEKESKNIKSVEAAIGAIARIIDEFGVALVDVNSVIDACKAWSAHIQKGIRDAAIVVFVAIYAQTGVMLKELMLNGLKPTTATAVEAEFASIGDVASSSFEPKRSVRGQVASAKLNLDDVIPRVDISEKMTESLLAKLADDQWKMRKEAMEEVHSILASSNHRIGGRDGGLFDALKLRLVDNNKNLAKDAIMLLSTIITDMGPPILKSASKLLPSLLTAVGDSKTFVKSEAIRTLDQWVDLSGLQAVIKYLPKSIDTASAGRKEVLELLLARLAVGPVRSVDSCARFDLNELVLSILALCVDKQPDVRALSEKVLEHVVASVGFDTVLEETKAMKKAMVLQIMPTMEKYRYTTIGGGNNASANTAQSASAEEEVRPTTAPARKATTKKPSVSSGSLTSREALTAGPTTVDEKKPAMLRARSRQSTLPAAIKKAPVEADVDTVEEVPSVAGVASSSIALVKKVDLSAKRARVLKDSKRVRGLYREYSPDEIDELDQTLYTLVVDDVYTLLAHKDFQKHVAAIDILDRDIDLNYDAVSSIADLLLKWCSWRMMDANTTVLAKMLPFVAHLFVAFESAAYKLTDGEAANVLPTLVEKALGHNTTRFRSDTKEIFAQACAIYPPAKVCACVTQGFESKNKRVQSECIELVGVMLAKHGVSVCDPRKVLPQIGVMVGASDAGVRTASLNALGAIYAVVGEEMWACLGRGATKEKIPQKQMAMIEERMRRMKASGGTATAAATQWVEEPTAASAAMPTSIPLPTASVSTPRKSIAPSGLMVRKKPIGVPVGGPSMSTPSKARAQTMRPGQFAAARAEFDASSHALDDGPDPAYAEPPVSRPLVQHTPVRTHARFHSNVGDYAHAGALEALASGAAANLPGCFSLELEPIDARQTQTGFDDADGNTASESIPSQGFGSSMPMHSPERAVAGGVAYSAFLSDTLIVLMEPSVPAGDRVEALQRMQQLLSSQGARAIAGNEEDLVTVLTSELANSFIVYPATGLVTVHATWNAAALAAIKELVSSSDMVAALSMALVEQLLEFLFSQLTDQRVLRSPACTTLVNGCNSLILKTLESLPRTSAFSLTIDLLHGSMMDPMRRAQIDLVAKCLSKLHQVLVREGAASLELSELLEAMRRFTDDISPADTTHDNAAVKSLLSVLHELVSQRGEEVLQAVAAMPPTCMLSQYIGQLMGVEAEPLETNNTATSAVAPTPVKRPVQIHSSSTAPSTATPPTPQARAQSAAAASVASPAGSPSAYREQLEAIKMKAASLSTPSASSPPMAHSSPSTEADDLSPPLTSVAAPPVAIAAAVGPKPPSALEAIRARFKTLAKTTEQENAQPINQSAPTLLSKPPTATASLSSDFPAPAPAGSSLLALRAKVAAMNSKKPQ